MTDDQTDPTKLIELLTDDEIRATFAATPLPFPATPARRLSRAAMLFICKAGYYNQPPDERSAIGEAILAHVRRRR